jgi:hypothetical protein
MRELFLHLDQFLTQTQPLWRFESFHLSAQPHAPWTDSHPDLQRWLMSLSEHQIEQFKASPATLLPQIGKFIEGLENIHRSLQLPSASCQAIDTAAIETGIPGRKLEQIRLIGGAAITCHQAQEWLEWCSGKGYLGRVLASATGQKVTSFEFQHTLCESGQSDADALGLPMQFVTGHKLFAMLLSSGAI